MPSTHSSPRAGNAIIVLCALLASVVYWRTAFPTISWWENGELTAAAGVLGIVHPPGALIPTIIGWLALRLPLFTSPAHWLNLLAGVIAGMTVIVVLIAARRLWTWQSAAPELHPSKTAYTSVAALAVLTFAFSRTLWSNGTLFTPYVFTAWLTAAIFLALLAWWRDADKQSVWRWTFVVILLLGLDFSVHRTNLLLLPGIVAWFLLRHRSLFRRWQLWAAGAGGAGLGFSIHLLLIPMARRMPALNSNNPGTIGGFWDYISLKQYGGGFLVDLLPRKGDFWTVQVADYLRGFADSFATLDGPLGPLGLVPLLLGIFGLIMLWRRSTRLAVGLLILFGMTSLGAIVYFNLPANFFRAMDRHYLPSFVLFAVFIVYGAVALAMIANRYRTRIVVLSVDVLLAAGAMAQITTNWRELDHSRTYFACDFGWNLLTSLPQQSIVITGSVPM
ncbi:MAG: DUF2723 domain-containing protein [candidate division Zixibacteria bacterium]|nr:DUF2723 domain-containing protein [candidate division Zixibacteria bacterium]